MVEAALHVRDRVVGVEVLQSGGVAWASIEPRRTLYVYDGGERHELAGVHEGTMTIYGTPEQLRDIGVMLVDGAQALINKKAADEAAATNDRSMVAQATREHKEVEHGNAG